MLLLIPKEIRRKSHYENGYKDTIRSELLFPAQRSSRPHQFPRPLVGEGQGEGIRFEFFSRINSLSRLWERARVRAIRF